MYRCQLNFAMFSATSVLGISWQHLNHPNLLAVYRFHVFFHVRLILNELHIFLPHEDSFSKVKNDYERGVHITVSVTSVVLIQMKRGCMENGFIRQIMVFLVMK